MPLPDPEKNEDEQDFVSRCIAGVPCRYWASPICFDQWRNRDKAVRIERAYSQLNVKSFDEDQRIITGIATTPQTDHYGGYRRAAWRIIFAPYSIFICARSAPANWPRPKGKRDRCRYRS